MADLTAAWRGRLLEGAPDGPAVIGHSAAAPLGRSVRRSRTARGKSGGERVRSWSDGLSDRTSMMMSQRFDRDYADFQLQVQSVFQCLRSLLDVWFSRSVSTQRLLELLAMFESGPLARLDLRQYYLLLLQRYSRDLELLRKTYQKHKDRPPIGRNLPPVSGRVLWSRQLFRKVEAPMMILKKKLDFLKGPEMTKVIRTYNQLAVVLLQYEVLHLQGWSQAAESAPRCLSATLLVRHEDSKEVSVNLDPVVLEVLQEARWMTKLGVNVPKVIQKMTSRESELRDLYSRLLEMLQDYSSVVGRVPPLLLPLMQPFIGRVEAALSPGLTSLSWTALNTERFLQNVYVALKDLDLVAKMATDLLDCRIGRLLRAMSSCRLLVLPEDSSVSAQDLLLQTGSLVQAAAVTLSW